MEWRKARHSRRVQKTSQLTLTEASRGSRCVFSFQRRASVFESLPVPKPACPKACVPQSLPVPKPACSKARVSSVSPSPSPCAVGVGLRPILLPGRVSRCGYEVSITKIPVTHQSRLTLHRNRMKCTTRGYLQCTEQRSVVRRRMEPRSAAEVRLSSCKAEARP